MKQILIISTMIHTRHFVFQNGMFAKEIENLDIYLIKNGSNDIRKEAIN